MNGSAFGNWLKRTMDLRGMNKAQLARASQTDRAYVQRLTAGMVAEPGDEARGRLHRAPAEATGNAYAPARVAT